jgi:hypothetical protein
MRCVFVCECVQSYLLETCFSSSLSFLLSLSLLRIFCGLLTFEERNLRVCVCVCVCVCFVLFLLFFLEIYFSSSFLVLFFFPLQWKVDRLTA